MVKNPYLKVWICNGYYDMATPYFATDYVIHHMFLPKDLQKNVSFTYYEAGHMMYIHKPSLLKLKKDYDQFMNDAFQVIKFARIQQVLSLHLVILWLTNNTMGKNNRRNFLQRAGALTATAFFSSLSKTSMGKRP